MSFMTDFEQSTEFVHLNRTLNVLETFKSEIESVAVILKRVLVPTKFTSEVSIVAKFSAKVNQEGT
jgi:hypothetical protein